MRHDLLIGLAVILAASVFAQGLKGAATPSAPNGAAGAALLVGAGATDAGGPVGARPARHPGRA